MVALVVLDTNALLLPFERRIRVEAEIERLVGPFQGLVPEACLEELRRIATQERGGRRDRAKMALVYAARFQAVPGDAPADQTTLRIAREQGAYLFTNDAELAKQAHGEGVPVIRLKGLSHLALHPEPDA